jgi:hypothetical protein
MRVLDIDAPLFTDKYTFERYTYLTWVSYDEQNVKGD